MGIVYTIMGILVPVIAWAAALTLAEITLSCAYRIAAVSWKALPRWSDMVPDAGWLLPELTGSGCLAALALLGVRPLLLAPAAGALFAVAVVPLANIMRIAAGQGEAKYAGRRIWRRLKLLAYTAREFLRQDMRALAGRRKGNRAPAASGRVPLRATPGVPPWKRAVPGIPPVASDPALGPAPRPSEVAAALAAGSVTVPPAWAAVASEAADHDPDDEDEHVEHMDGEIAGVLSWAEGAMSRAETLGDASITGLAPAYVNAQFELADVYAECASHAAQVMKRYHDIYDDIGEAAGDTPLPAKRHWFNGGGGAPQGGRAA